jgi:hypothetical protein
MGGPPSIGGGCQRWRATAPGAESCGCARGEECSTMDFYDEKLFQKMIEAAVLLPSLADGGKLKIPQFEIRERPGNFALFIDGKYEVTTGEKDRDRAVRWMNVYVLQWIAAQDATYDVRRVPALACLEHRKKMAVRKGLAGAAVIASTLDALAPHLKDLQLRHLTDDWVEEAEDRFCEKHSYEYFHNALRFLRTGIRDFTKKEAGAYFLPFDVPPAAPGKVKVLSEVELGTIRRWSTGAERFVPKKRLWLPPCEEMTATERRDRRLVYRQCWLGMNFGSRSGIYDKLSHVPHDEGGWFDLDNAVFLRVPPGTQTHANKLAPSVDLDADSVAELSRWRDEDDGNPWVFPAKDGGPLGCDRQAVIFGARMEELGIEATGHTLRHSFITEMIRRGVAAPVISSVAGVSIRMLHDRYDHRDHRAVQKLAHGVMGHMFG